MHSFSVSIFPWFRASFTCEGDTLTITSNNAFLIFPAGKRTEKIPLKDISSCSFSTWYDPVFFFVGAIFVVMSFLSYGNPLITGSFLLATRILFAVLGCLFLLSGAGGTFSIEKKGLETRYRVPFYARKKAREASEWVLKIADT